MSSSALTTWPSAENDTAVPAGSGHVFEVVHPDLGYWIDRMKLYLKGDKNKDMGDDYNHSTFIDLVLSGLFGLRGRADGVVEIDPLIPTDGSITHCAVDHVTYVEAMC